MSFLKGKKTYIVALLLVIISLLDVATGDLALADFLASDNLILLLEGLGIAALRHGIG